jgi:glycosyltransferase involved in cell wall biosynthesis
LLANCFSAWPYSVAKHHSRRFRQTMRDLHRARGFDLLQVEWTPYASHLGAGAPPYLIASHNIEAQIWRRRAEVSGHALARFYFNWQAVKMERFERRVFRRARAVTVVSASDRAQAQGMGAAHSRIVANGVDLDDFRPAPGLVPSRLLFLGALDWFPNQDAVIYFVDTMLPLIRARRAGVEFKIVGRRPPATLRRRLETEPGVELVGEVADVRPWLASAAVVVVPLRVGGGSRIKIIEALAMEKAVIATTIGAEGLELRSGSHLLIADTPQQFARLTVQLLTSPEQCAHLGQAGGRWVRDRYSWDDSARALEAEWRRAAAGLDLHSAAGRRAGAAVAEEGEYR